MSDISRALRGESIDVSNDHVSVLKRAAIHLCRGENAMGTASLQVYIRSKERQPEPFLAEILASNDKGDWLRSADLISHGLIPFLCKD